MYGLAAVTVAVDGQQILSVDKGVPVIRAHVRPPPAGEGLGVTRHVAVLSGDVDRVILPINF